MKLNNNIITAFLLTFISSFAAMTVASAQSVSEEVTRSKCEVCAKLQPGSKEYVEAECRIYAQICSDLAGTESGAIIIGTNDTMAVESAGSNGQTLVSDSEVPLLLFLDTFDDTYYNVTPIITLLNGDKKVIHEFKSNIFEQYIFDINHKIVSVQGVKTIEKLSKNTNMVLASKLKFPEITTKYIYVQVELQSTNPKTGEVKVIKTLYSFEGIRLK